MKEKILTALRARPNGMRLRELGSECGTWHPNLLPTIYELLDAGLITRTSYRDMANMEFYDIYKIGA